MAKPTAPTRSSSLNHEQAARRYIKAHMDAHYTGLPQEHREIHLGTLRELERQDPRVRERALVGAPRHTGPLEAGEREHQKWMREQAGISHSELLERRRVLDSPPGGGGRRRAPAAPPRRSPSRAPSPGARQTARTARTIANAAGARQGKNTVIRALGVIVALSVLYLILSKRGSRAFSGVLGIATGLLKNLIGSGDILANPLGGHKSSSALGNAAVNALDNGTGQTPAGTLAGGPFAPTPQSVGAAAVSAPQVGPSAAALLKPNVAPGGKPTSAPAVPPLNGGIVGQVYNPATGQFVPAASKNLGRPSRPAGT